MNIKALVFSALLLGCLPFAAQSDTSGPTLWVGSPIELQSPTAPSLKVRINSVNELKSGQPVAGELENLTGDKLAVSLVFKRTPDNGFEGRWSGYVAGYGKVNFQTPNGYSDAPPPSDNSMNATIGLLTIKLAQCISKGTGK